MGAIRKIKDSLPSSSSSAYGPLKANAACHTPLHRSLSPTSSTLIVSSKVRRSFSTVSSHLCLGLPHGLFLFNVSCNISFNSLPSALQTCPTHCICLLLTKATTLGCLNRFLNTYIMPNFVLLCRSIVVWTINSS